jgi:hypothetical protein
MQPGTLVLVHGPLTGAAVWGELPAVLRSRGYPVVVPEITGDDQSPYAARYVAAAALQIARADLVEPLVLVAHSGAGPLLAQVAATQRAAHRAVGGYLFVDAGLPRGGAVSRLALMEAEDAEFARELHERLHAGGEFPTWTEGELAEEVPDPGVRAELVASLRPRGHDFFTEPLPFPGDWPDAPCGYLRTSAAYDVVARVAAHRSWPVVTLDLGHFAALRAPGAVADALTDLLAAL